MANKISLFVFSLLLALPFNFCAAATKELEENTSTRSIEDLLNNISNYILAFLGALAVLFIIVAGIRLILSSGNADEAKTAKQNLTYAILGLLAVLFAKFLLVLIVNVVGEVA